LGASYYFYLCWKVEYIFLILASTLIDYLCGLRMEKAATRRRKLPYLLLSLVTNLGLLFAFKYFNFFSASVNSILSHFTPGHDIPMMQVLLPVGISFYTFQTLSYSIDVYFGKQKAERHLGYFALYVAFFPQLVAGPIERFSRLSPQLKAFHQFSWSNLVMGLRLILYGFFIKMVVADNLSVLVDQVYDSPADYASTDILKALFFYSFQIYCDFFGYSSIAIGSARIMGIRIMDNFMTPYLAQNIAEFWKRWHISLSTWFRDYLYYPLGGNRVSKIRWIINIMVVFVVSGLWHGANWTFIIWGGLFGLVYILERQFNTVFRLNKTFPAYSATHILLALKTFIVVTFIWIFFRSQSLGSAIDLLKLILKTGREPLATLTVPPVTWIMLLLFILSDFLLYDKRFDGWMSKLPVMLRWLIYAIVLFAIIVFSGVENFPFIYFQF